MGNEHQTILIVDEDWLPRTGFASLLREELNANVTEAVSVSDIHRDLEKAEPLRAVFIALCALGNSAVEILRETRARNPHLIVAVTGTFSNPSEFLPLLEAGAHGCIPIDAPRSVLVAALKTVIAGGVFAPDPISLRVHAGGSAPFRRTPFPDLTARQWQVLELMASGLSNKLIARTLNISEGTVKVHLNTAFRVLGVHNRVSAVAALQGKDQRSAEGQPMLPGLDSPSQHNSYAALFALAAGAVIHQIEYFPHF